MAVRTGDAGKATARVAAVEAALDHLLDYGSEERVLLLEAAFILHLKPVEVMEKHAVEDSLLWMKRTIIPGIAGRNIQKTRQKNAP